MSVARRYLMQAADGQSDALALALEALADAVLALPGCIGVEVLQDQAEANHFLFVEEWESVEAHKNAGKFLPKAIMTPVGAALGAPPQGAYMTYRKRI